MKVRRAGIASIAVIAVLIGIFWFVPGAARAQSGAAARPADTAASGPRKAEEQFKNIQVLKGVPADQIFPTMQFISASLGVECEFCHVQGKFEKDDKKPKQTARKMMEMMFAINKENFDGHRAVTCNSCHRGNASPQAIPAVMAEESKEAMGAAKATSGAKPPMAPPNPTEAKGDTGPAAEQLLDKYLQAAGGADAIEKVNSRVMKGTMDFGGKSVPIDIYSKDPYRRVSFTHMPEGDSVTAFDGHDGWLGMSGHPLREMHGGDLDGASIDADLHLAAHLKPMFNEMEVQGKENVGDHSTYVVLGRRDGKPPISLYFDEQSGLLVRMVRFADTALGLLPTQIDYADYRDLSGVKIPYRWTLARPGGRFTIQLSEVKQNVPVDDAKFAKPAAQEPKAPAK
jgi:photosynthetic reaction center cytochrome c subunit